MDRAQKSVKNRLKVLMVEDTRTDAELIERELERAGFDCVARRVASEADCVRALEEFTPDVIICDYGLPGFGGARALAVCKAKAPDTPFIYVSGTIGEERAIEALRDGAADYILKDNVKRLPSAVQRALREVDERMRRRRADEEISRQRVFLRQVIDLVPNFIFAKDREGRFILVNRAVADAYGTTVEQLLGKTDADFNSDAEEVKHFRRVDLEVMDSLREVFTPEETITDASGKERWLQTIKRPIVSEHGTADMVLGVATDITERKYQEERIARLGRMHAVLSGINGLIVRVRERDELFREACRIAVDHGKFHMAWIGVVNRDLNRLDSAALCGGEPEFVETIRRRDWIEADASGNRAAVGRVLIEKRAVFSNDIQTDPRIRYANDHMEQGTRSLAVLPLMIADSVAAVLVLHARETEFFDEEEKRLLLELAGDISFALDHIEKEAKLDYLAYYDSVTGLANRTLFHERLEQGLAAAGREGRKLALIILDVERFKTINDTLGRQAGDTLLKQIADRMAGYAPDIAWLARIGADHFAIMAPDIQNVDDLPRLTEQRLEKFFGLPFQIGETELRIGAKLGLAVFPGDAADAETLFRNAEAALKKAKASGDRFLFYTQAMNERVAEKMELENKLRQALEKDEFVLHYQPKVDTETRSIVGVEALIRWQSPELGLVPPMKFIPLLEETGLILPVGAWALKRASLDHRNWVNQGLKAPRVAVNVSPIQLRQRDFVGIVEQAIIDGVAPTGIDLEITESLIMKDIKGNIEKLKSVRGFGVSVAIDDFGTGYSSLGYLAKLPVQTLKIDRSFIITMLNDSGAMTLVQTMISLAHSLKLKVVAEGVDAEEQANMLRLLRCDEMQGYLFSRPVPFDEMTTLLAREGKS